MTLHFAYGANMSRDIMRRYAPNAEPHGPALLRDHRFLISTDGYASVSAAPGQTVHGVVWRLTARDRVSLDAWENTAAGLYRAECMTVQVAGRTASVLVTASASALVYVARSDAVGRPRPGYMELVVAAAQEWDLPAAYRRSLTRWSRAQKPLTIQRFKGPGIRAGEIR